MLAGKLQPDDQSSEVPELLVSYKPQQITAKSERTVRILLQHKINEMLHHPTFKTDVLGPLQVERLYDLEVGPSLGGDHQFRCKTCREESCNESL